MFDDFITGCLKNGVNHASGTEWTEPSDPCKVFTCNAGVITESKMRCHTPCANPTPPMPGQCCPTCAGTTDFLNCKEKI